MSASNPVMRRGVISCSIVMTFGHCDLLRSNHLSDLEIASSSLCNDIKLFDKQSSDPQQQHARQHPAEYRHGHGFARHVFLDQFGDLINDFEDRASANSQEQHGKEGRRSIAADPGAEDGWRAADQYHEGEPAKAWPG